MRVRAYPLCKDLERLASSFSELLLLVERRELGLLLADRYNTLRGAVLFCSGMEDIAPPTELLKSHDGGGSDRELTTSDKGINCLSRSTPGSVWDLMPARHTQIKWTQGRYPKSLSCLMLSELSLIWEGREMLSKSHFKLTGSQNWEKEFLSTEENCDHGHFSMRTTSVIKKSTFWANNPWP